MAECERVDGIPIENIGTLPDLPRPVVISDVHNGFTSYAEDILVMAVELAENKSRKELQTILTNRVAGRTRSDLSEERVEPAKALLNGFAESEIFKQAEVDLEHAASSLSEAYQSLARGLAEVGKDFSRQEWQMLTIPIPNKLIGKDHIMASLWKKDAMIERLEQLPSVPSWKGKHDILNLATSLAASLKAIPGDIRVADNCNLLLFTPSELDSK